MITCICVYHIYIYTYIVYMYACMPAAWCRFLRARALAGRARRRVRVCVVRVADGCLDSCYEESTWLAQTRLTQNTLNK